MDKEANSIELRYELYDKNCHVIDASVESEGVVVFLQSVNYISKVLGVRSNTETTSLKQGSVIRLFRIVIEEQDESGWLLFLLMNLLNCALFNNGSIHVSSILDSLTPEQMEQLQSVLKHKRITLDKLKRIPSEEVLLRKKANFFKKVSSAKNVSAVTIGVGADFYIAPDKRVRIPQSDFKKFIVETVPEEVIVEDAVVYIVAPVIIKGKKIQWKGIYENEFIAFTMCSNEFKTKAQNSDVNFSSGFNIVCTLTYIRSIDDEGKEYKSHYKVTFVSRWGIDDHYQETLEGKKKRIDDSQPTLFDGQEF